MCNPNSILFMPINWQEAGKKGVWIWDRQHCWLTLDHSKTKPEVILYYQSHITLQKNVYKALCNLYNIFVVVSTYSKEALIAIRCSKETPKEVLKI